MPTASNLAGPRFHLGSRAFACVCMLIACLVVTACLAPPVAPIAEEPRSGSPEGQGAMVAPNPPGVWYAGDFVSLEEAAAKVPFTILIPDEAVVGAELVSVELNDLETVLAVALHYANEVVVDQEASSITSLPDTLRPFEQWIEVNGIPATGKEAGYTWSEISGGKVPFPATVSWYVDGIYRYVTSDDLPLQRLIQIAESMKPYSPSGQ